jgi:hypothetical protein
MGDRGIFFQPAGFISSLGVPSTWRVRLPDALKAASATNPQQARDEQARHEATPPVACPLTGRPEVSLGNQPAAGARQARTPRFEF